MVKVKGPIGQSIFSFSFFFFSRFGSGQICGSVRVRSGQIGSIEDDVIHDVTALRARAARASAWLGEVVRKLKAATAESFGGAWRRVLGFLGPKFLGFVDLRP